MKCIAYFSVIEPLSICEQFIDKKKAMVTYGNFFLSDTVMHKYIQSSNLHITEPDREKKNKLALNTIVGHLFLLGYFLRHYFVDSNMRNL